jgi:hypothetical protein
MEAQERQQELSSSGGRSTQDLKSIKCQRDLDCEVQGVDDKISSKEISESEAVKSKVYLDCLGRGGYMSAYLPFREGAIREEGVSQHQKLSKV